jgi:hypothetical protein
LHCITVSQRHSELCERPDRCEIKDESQHATGRERRPKSDSVTQCPHQVKHRQSRPNGAELPLRARQFGVAGIMSQPKKVEAGEGLVIGALKTTVSQRDRTLQHYLFWNLALASREGDWRHNHALGFQCRGSRIRGAPDVSNQGGGSARRQAGTWSGPYADA